MLPASEGSDQEAQRDVIQLLCSIFMANQGGSEGSGEDKHLQMVGPISDIEFCQSCSFLFLVY